ncbi:MAG: hypothetical protein ACRES5_23585, partial [Pseudomonas sp.]
LQVMRKSCGSELARDAFRAINAPTECTVNRNRAQQPIQNPACVHNRTPIEKTRKPRITGLSALQSDFLFQAVKTWHAPCNNSFR